MKYVLDAQKTKLKKQFFRKDTTKFFHAFDFE